MGTLQARARTRRIPGASCKSDEVQHEIGPRGGRGGKQRGERRESKEGEKARAIEREQKRERDTCQKHTVCFFHLSVLPSGLLGLFSGVLLPGAP